MITQCPSTKRIFGEKPRRVFSQGTNDTIKALNWEIVGSKYRDTVLIVGCEALPKLVRSDLSRQNIDGSELVEDDLRKTLARNVDRFNVDNAHPCVVASAVSIDATMRLEPTALQLWM